MSPRSRTADCLCLSSTFFRHVGKVRVRDAPKSKNSTRDSTRCSTIREIIVWERTRTVRSIRSPCDNGECEGSMCASSWL